MPVRLFAPRRATSPSSEVPESPTHADAEEPTPPLARGREAAALLLFTLAAFLCLALASYRFDPADPTLTGSDWVGPVGAFVASILVSAFGLAAWFAPIELALLSAPLFTRRPNRATSLRFAGDLVVAIVLASLLQVLMPRLLAFGRGPVGGQVGLLFGELMRAMFSTVGSILVASTIVGLILIGRSSFSFIELCGRAVDLARWSVAKLKVVGKKMNGAWQEAVDIRRERRAAAREQPEPLENRPSDASIMARLQQLPDASDLLLETTGTPPLALSTQLKRGLRLDADRLLDSTPGDALADALTSSPELKATTEATEPVEQPESRRAPDAAEQPAEDPELAVAEATVEPEIDAVEPEVDEPVVDEESDAPPAEAGAKPSRPKKSKKKSDKALKEPTIVDTSPQQRVEREKSRRRERSGVTKGFKLPSTDLLHAAPPTIKEVSKDTLLELANLLEKTLADHKVICKVQEIHPGPTVTTYEVAPKPGTRVRQVAGLSDDLALGLSRKVRIIAPIPGKSRIGFELPNDERVPVNLRELVEDKRFAELARKAPLPIVFGRDIVGAPFYADLAKMPHVIVAGATGAGKSVGLNVMLASMLFHRTPAELRMLMIDPKVVELAPFDGIPHMLLPVVTDMKQAVTALKWAVDEMERRYKLFAKAGTKNITTYNGWVKKIERGEVPAPEVKKVTGVDEDGNPVIVDVAKDGSDGDILPERLPFIVIVVDEFADLMMQQGKEVEAAVARLAQKARAAGMHVVLATQRPSVDVITGMIKANFPTRVAFRVAQKVDGRTILDEQGAELLLGAGDMLVKLNGGNETKRVQCPFISEEEVTALTDHLRAQGEPVYNEAILAHTDEESSDAPKDEKVDARFDEAVQIVAETQRCSTSWLQRKLTIGYNRAAKIVEMMEQRGMVGPPNGSKDREIYMSPQ